MCMQMPQRPEVDDRTPGNGVTTDGVSATQ